MSAIFNTTIKASGSKEGLVALLEVARYYEDERLKQYQNGEPYYVDYLECVEVCQGDSFDEKHSVRLKDIESIEAFINDIKGSKIVLCAEGPYERGFATLDEIDLYNDMASKLDSRVDFEGESSGSNDDYDQLLRVIYRDGKLKMQLSFENEAEEYDEDAENDSDDINVEELVEKVTDVLSLDDFIFIFKINGEILSEDYEGIVEDILIYKNEFEEVFGDREIFEDYISGYINSDEAYSISDEDFISAVKTLGTLGIKEKLI